MFAELWGIPELDYQEAKKLILSKSHTTTASKRRVLYDLILRRYGLGVSVRQVIEEMTAPVGSTPGISCSERTAKTLKTEWKNELVNRKTRFRQSAKIYVGMHPIGRSGEEALIAVQMETGAGNNIKQVTDIQIGSRNDLLGFMLALKPAEDLEVNIISMQKPVRIRLEDPNQYDDTDEWAECEMRNEDVEEKALKRHLPDLKKLKELSNQMLECTPKLWRHKIRITVQALYEMPRYVQRRKQDHETDSNAVKYLELAKKIGKLQRLFDVIQKRYSKVEGVESLTSFLKR